jgi:hypothetical protein
MPYAIDFEWLMEGRMHSIPTLASSIETWSLV